MLARSHRKNVMRPCLEDRDLLRGNEILKVEIGGFNTGHDKDTPFVIDGVVHPSVVTTSQTAYNGQLA